MTPQSLDAVVALVDRSGIPTPAVEMGARMVALARQMMWEDEATAMLVFTELVPLADETPDWHPTPEAINALPQPLRDYIHTSQTSHPSYDNAVKVRLLE